MLKIMAMPLPNAGLGEFLDRLLMCHNALTRQIIVGLGRPLAATAALPSRRWLCHRIRDL